MDDDYQDEFEERLDPPKPKLPAWTSTHWAAGQTWMYAPIDLLTLPIHNLAGTTLSDPAGGDGANGLTVRAKKEVELDKSEALAEIEAMAERNDWTYRKYKSWVNKVNDIPASSFRQGVDDLLAHIRSSEDQLLRMNLELSLFEDDRLTVWDRVENINDNSDLR